VKSRKAGILQSRIISLGDDFNIHYHSFKINHMSFVTYLKEVKGELKHVSWPTRKQTIIFTIIVVVLSIVTATLLGVFDTIFGFILENIV